MRDLGHAYFIFIVIVLILLLASQAVCSQYAASMAHWSIASLTEDCNITSDFHEYFEERYDGACMEHHSSLNHCSFPWVSRANMVMTTSRNFVLAA